MNSPVDSDEDKTPTADEKPSYYQRITVAEYTIVSKEFESLFLSKLNNYRVSQGRSAYEVNKYATLTANFRSYDMATNKYLEHTSPTYGSHMNVLYHFNPNAKMGSEVILRGYYNAEDVNATAERMLEAFKNSPGHNETMLSHAFDQVGIGLQLTEGGTGYLTVTFTSDVD